MPRKYESTISVKKFLTYQLNRLNLNLNVQLKCAMKINAFPIGICFYTSLFLNAIY